MMVVVAISAIGINWFRPISPAEAERIAEAKFLSIPGASRWVGHYRVQAGYAGTFDTDQPKRYVDGWTVVVSDPKDDFPVMQMFLTPKGRTRAVDFAPGKFNGIASSPDKNRRPRRCLGIGLLHAHE
jgi:hypothetical protein